MQEFSSNVVFDEQHLRDVRDYFLRQDAFVFDVETVGEHRNVPQVNQVMWMSLSTIGKTVVIPMGHPNGNVLLRKATRRKNKDTAKFDMFPAVYDDPPDQLQPAEVFGGLKELFFNPEIRKIAHNATFDIGSVAKYYEGHVPVGPYDDTIVLAWLLNENRRLGLKDLTISEYRRKYDNENTGRRVEIHPFNKVARYSFMDAKFTWLHWRNLINEIDDQDLSRVLELERETMAVLLDVGLEGTVVDVEGMKTLEETLSARSVEIEGRIYQSAGYKFNINSNPQKVQALYGPKNEGGQGLKPWRFTKGGFLKDKRGEETTLNDYSTDKEALEKFYSNKLATTLLEYQEVARVLGTYVQGYLGVEGDKKKPGMIFNGDRVYPDFVQYGTVTGRLSCRSPNLQNIPRPDSDLGKAIRGLFVAPVDHRLIVADYGQIEMVILAHFAGPGALWDGFFKGIDPHTVTAAHVFGVDPDDPSVGKGSVLRQNAKNINFAVVYGAGPDKVASMSKTTPTKAKAFLKAHERAFPEIYTFKDRVLETCRSRSSPYIRTITGRKRRLPTIWASDFGVRGKAERQAVNSLIQGSSADLIKFAMVRCNEAFKQGSGAKLQLTVHDELVAAAANDHADAAAADMLDAMTGKDIQAWVRVPLVVDLKIVDRWAEAK